MELSFPVHSQPTHSNQLTLSAELWSLLTQQLSSEGAEGGAGADPIPVAISARFGLGNRKGGKSLVVLAGRESQKLVNGVNGKHAKIELHTQYLIHVPLSLLALHPFLSPRSPLQISPTTPIPLTTIILISLSSSSYTYATTHQDEFAGVVRQGEVLQVGEGKWEVGMCEPVLQGLVVQGDTRFFVLPPNSTGEEEGGEDEKEDEDSDSGYTIDEEFLSQSILPPLLSSPTSTPLKESNSLALIPNGHPTISKQLNLSPFPLKHPIASELLIPAPLESEDDQTRVYLRLQDLSKVGAFSGDWCVVDGGGGQRLVRVFAAENVLSKDELNGTLNKNTIETYLPPLLLHNLSLTSQTLSITPTHLPSPSLPTALSVTVSRLASPHSINKIYQPLFLTELKNYFWKKKRVARVGDLISVGISEEGLRFTSGENEDEIQLPATSTPSPTAVIYFRITSLTLPPSVLLPRTPGYTTESELIDKVDRGEFGALIDPGLSELVQSGVEKGWSVPSSGFLGLVEQPTVSIGESGSETVGRKLWDYLISLRKDGVGEYDLDLTVLLKGARGCGKRTLVRGMAGMVGFHLLELDCFDLLGETDIKTEGHLRSRIDKALSCSPCILLLRNIEALARKSQSLESGQEPAMTTILKECFSTVREGWKSSGFPTVIIATTVDSDKIPTGVLGSFKTELQIDAPNESERHTILETLTKNDVLSPDVSLRTMAIQTAALVASDLVSLIRLARSASISRILLSSSPAPSLLSIRQAGISLTSADLTTALEKSRLAYSESIGAPKIPNVTWDDVGGLGSVKGDILDTIQLPLERPELFMDGLKKRSGILLYGPPGTGKTLLAKAVATTCSLNFFSIKGPELLNMYIGESEANVRRVFQRARDAKPCVIFFDELDSVAPKRGQQGDSGGVMDRIVSQLLAELDGMSGGKGGEGVFVIGATNRPDLLDPALLRPGRFDRMLYLGVSETHEAQLKILQALTRKFKLGLNVDLEKVAQQCPFNYTGADFYALCSDAMLGAMSRKAEEIDGRINQINLLAENEQKPITAQYYLTELATSAEVEVLVEQVDFEKSLAELVPSVSKAEMRHYKSVQREFSGPSSSGVHDEEEEERELVKVDKGKGKGKGKAVDQ